MLLIRPSSGISLHMRLILCTPDNGPEWTGTLMTFPDTCRWAIVAAGADWGEREAGCWGQQHLTKSVWPSSYMLYVYVIMHIVSDNIYNAGQLLFVICGLVKSVLFWSTRIPRHECEPVHSFFASVVHRLRKRLINTANYPSWKLKQK